MIIVVRGIPAPQGSKRHVGGGRMIESSRAVGPWREAVRAGTQRVMTITGQRVMDGPVRITIHFYLPRPKTAPKAVTWPAKRPDLDKLCRSVLDGLTAGGAWEDDAQVVVLRAWKSFATAGTPPRCHIELKEEL